MELFQASQLSNPLTTTNAAPVLLNSIQASPLQDFTLIGRSSFTSTDEPVRSPFLNRANSADRLAARSKNG